MGRDRDRTPNCAIAKPSTKSSMHERRAHHDAIASIAAIAIVDADVDGAVIVKHAVVAGQQHKNRAEQCRVR